MSPKVSIYTPFFASYIETALWSSTDEDGTPLDDTRYRDVEFSPGALQQIKEDCESFVKLSAGILDANTSDYPVAHDFWLTRNGHGAGFWDGDYPETIGKQLTDLAHSFGECDLYFGDDGKLYIS